MLTNVPKYTWVHNKRLTVVNLFGGPSVGKSFLSRPLVHELCSLGVKCQPVQEFAKEVTWDNREIGIQDQLYILGTQHHLLRRLIYHDVDVAVLDSSILLGIMYASPDMPQAYLDMVLATYHSYNNINIFVKRSPTRDYEQTGRNQTPDEARQIDEEILTTLDEHDIPYLAIFSDQVDEAVDYVLTSLPGALTQ